MIGEQLGSYRVESVLGTGAMGVVYKATAENGKAAAVKVISADVTQRSKTYERFRREAEILKQFRHPNIVRFLAFGRSKGTSYFAMEYVPGETLEALLQRRGALPWRDVVNLGIQVCEALHYAHEKGIVHRDLKPSNLMVTDKGQIKLTDFGIAKDLDATALTATGRTLGTAAYMAPEQIRGTPEISHKTDLYALGIVLYQMLTGKAAFEGTSAVVLMHCHLTQPAPRPSAKVAEIPVALDKLVVQLMAKDPAERPWDAAAAAVALSDIRDRASRGETVPMVWPTEGDVATAPSRGGTEAPTRTKSSKTSGKKRRLIPKLDRAFFEVLLLVGLLAAIVGGVGYMLWPPSAEYLHGQAARLMASSHRHDWITARDDYIDPLDRRFPNHPYREETTAWRDKIVLEDARRRASVLTSEAHTAFNEPKPGSEQQFVVAYKLAKDASDRGDDRLAVQHWQDLIKQFDEKDSDDRPWVLYARERIKELENEMKTRRAGLIQQLDLATKLEHAGNTRKAELIRAQQVDLNGKYADLADIFEANGLSVKPPRRPDESAPDSSPKLETQTSARAPE